MNFDDFIWLNASAEEANVCCILCRDPEKYLNALPYHVQESDFTREDCRNVLRTVRMLHDQGQPHGMFDVYCHIRNQYRESGKPGDFPERRVIFHEVEDSRMDHSARTVRLAGLIRRLREDVWESEEARIAARQEYDSMASEIEALQQKFQEEEDERMRQLQQSRAQEQLRQQIRTCSPEMHPMLPVLMQMAQELASGAHSSFWSYTELRSACQQALGYDPVRHPRELLSLLPDAFLNYLAEKEGILVQLRQRYSHTRGLRITQVYRKRSYQEKLTATVFTPQKL